MPVRQRHGHRARRVEWMTFSHPDKSEKGSIGYDTANYSARIGPLKAA
jgi:hypothetical protein